MTVTNFEEVTKELSEDEFSMLPNLIQILQEHADQENAIYSNDLCRKMATRCKVEKFSGPRLRKMVNYLRVNGILPVIATSKGYYLSYNKDIIELQIKSLFERASAIRKSAYGLQKFLDPNYKPQGILL
ncbi:MAG: hypothetical protein H8E51_07035 [Bacteroidetes bacterium]|nr:hypothetical protein [Bacteroidota bacterium]